MNRRLTILTIPALLAIGCYDPEPPETPQCLDFITEAMTIERLDEAGTPHPGQIYVGDDVRFEWHNRLVRVGDIEVAIGDIAERIEFSGTGTRGAIEERITSAPPETQQGEVRSIDLSELLVADTVDLPSGEYNLEVSLDLDDATGHQCLGYGHGHEEMTFEISECFCEGTYHSVDLLVQNVALDPLVPQPGEDFEVHWEAAIDADTCVPGDGVAGRFVERLTLQAIGGATYGPIERTVGAFSYDDVSSRSIEISEFYRGDLPPAGDYELTIELDPTGVVPECVTPDDEIDFANNTQTHLVTIPALPR
ncbi:MAG: hypothetical protein KTR31_32995 [Myxococcales bacterium]|nr:hypothetical protein [Myxococcales bacterium]